jgi:PAP2 superfamily
MLKKIDRAAVATWGSIAAAFALFFALGARFGFGVGGGPLALTGYYVKLLGLSVLEYGSVLYEFFYITVLLVVIGGMAKLFMERNERQYSFSPYRSAVTILKKLFRAACIIAPALLFIIFVSFVMSEANAWNKTRLADNAILGIEKAITGNYVFAALGAIHYPHLLIVFIVASFECMAVFIIAAGLVVGYEHPELLREMVVAFCIGIFIMIPMWLAVPALSPQDRFINNVYHLTDPPAVALAVSSYHPQAEIADFLAGVRAEKSGESDMPTSTLPSAHVFWAVLAGYYLFRSRRLFGWIALPILIASTFGTVLLAQHYLLDVPAAIIVAIFSIWAAHWLCIYKGGSAASR